VTVDAVERRGANGYFISERVD